MSIKVQRSEKITYSILLWIMPVIGAIVTTITKYGITLNIDLDPFPGTYWISIVWFLIGFPIDMVLRIKYYSTVHNKK